MQILSISEVFISWYVYYLVMISESRVTKFDGIGMKWMSSTSDKLTKQQQLEENRRLTENRTTDSSIQTSSVDIFPNETVEKVRRI